jgi:hypothetical protein
VSLLRLLCTCCPCSCAAEGRPGLLPCCCWCFIAGTAVLLLRRAQQLLDAALTHSHTRRPLAHSLSSQGHKVLIFSQVVTVKQASKLKMTQLASFPAAALPRRVQPQPAHPRLVTTPPARQARIVLPYSVSCGDSSGLVATLNHSFDPKPVQDHAGCA